MNRFDTLCEILKDRYSCRAFLPRPVPDSTITQIVTAARHVPSWCNAQPWQVSITKGEATQKLRNALEAEAAKGSPPTPDLDWPITYEGVYAERRRTCGFQLYDAVGIEKSDRKGRQAQMMRNFALFDAPHVAIVHSPSTLGPYGAMDCGGFVTGFALAATALGLASIPQAAVTSYSAMVRTHLGLAADRQVLCAISFGYPDQDHPANQFRTERADADDIIAWHG